MTKPNPDKAIIDSLGGPAEVARKLGLDTTGATQRVHNWTHRGIPAEVRLAHLDLFGMPPVNNMREAG